MRDVLGLRVQLLLLLGLLLLAAQLPLHLTTRAYARVSLDHQAVIHAQTLARLIELDLAERPEPGGIARWARRLRSVEPASWQVSLGAPGLAPAPATIESPARTASIEQSDGAPAMSDVVIRTVEGELRIAPDTGAAAATARNVSGMLGLSALVLSALLLLLSYVGLTRSVVHPLEAVAGAAESIILGRRAISIPRMPSREFSELSDSLRRMLEHLLGEEAKLRRQLSLVEEATEKLKSTQAQLLRSERLASLGRLCAGLAHEIGNPLSALMGLADELLGGELEPAMQRDFLSRMRREIERIHQTLQDLLQFARYSSPAPHRRDIAPADPVAAIAETLKLLQHDPRARGVDLHAEGQAARAVALDHQALLQLLLNLGLNALDAVRDQERPAVVFSVEESGGVVRINVTDNGPGVTHEAREHLFEPFFTTKPVGQGSGLGLSICQALAKAAGGSLELDTTHARGARFVVTLPALER